MSEPIEGHSADSPRSPQPPESDAGPVAEPFDVFATVRRRCGGRCLCPRTETGNCGAQVVGRAFGFVCRTARGGHPSTTLSLGAPSTAAPSIGDVS